MSKSSKKDGKTLYYDKELKDSLPQAMVPEQLEAVYMPVVPDPFWPAGALPSHLSVEQCADASIITPFKDLSSWKCERCGTTLNQSVSNPKLCNDCYVQDAQNTELAKRTNETWMDQSKELGLAIFERQPEETDEEWRIWEKYRSYYPLRQPTWTELATSVGRSVAMVTRTSNRWSFRVRLVAWAQYTDDLNQESRIIAIKEMNEKQLTLSKMLQSKLLEAINGLDAATLKPTEISNLLKVSSDLERRIVTYQPEKVNSSLEETAKVQQTTKTEDLADIIAILQKSGVLDGKSIGIETTTRVIAREDD